MIRTGQTIKGPIAPGGQKNKYLVIRAGVIRRDGSQRVTARRQSEGVGGTLMETEITLSFPKEGDYGEWSIVG